MFVLGVSGLGHDAAAALVRDGEVVAAAQEERFTGRKHETGLPLRAARFCCRSAGIGSEQLEALVFHQKPFRTFERLLVTQLRGFPRSCSAFARTMVDWLGDRLWIKGRLADEFSVPPSRVLFAAHHEAHAASAFFASPFDEAAVLTIDGVGEWATTAMWAGRGLELELLHETRFPHSLGLFCAAVADYLGFGTAGAGHVMALASYGEPRFQAALASCLMFDDDGGFRVDARAFRSAFDPDRGFGPHFAELLGPARAPGTALQPDGSDRRFADVAASAQAVLEDAVLRLCRSLHRRLPRDVLCLAGGVLHNVRVTARVLRDGPFRRVFVAPSPGNAGAAMGAALLGWRALAGPVARVPLLHAFLGDGPGDELPPGGRDLPGDDDVAAETARLLAKGSTVGFVQGRFEWGPRALGHRSLLADPRDPARRLQVSAASKQREWFRPFAPAATAERAAEFFALPAGGSAPLRYMLVSVDATAAGRAACPAALHVDGTARLQVVDRATDPLFHATLTQFGAATSVPVLLHTSLNARGQPIVRDARAAHELWQRGLIDALVVGRRVWEH